MTTPPTDEILIQGLIERDSAGIKLLYKEFFHLACSIVEKNSGSYEDAEDLFQDSIVILYKRLCHEKINLTCSLKTFFYGICKNLWKQRLDRRWRLQYSENLAEEPVHCYEIARWEFGEETLERKRLFLKHYFELSKRCQKILALFLSEMPLKQIARELGMKNEEYVKTRKYTCKRLLRKKIMSDPQCKPYLLYD